MGAKYRPGARPLVLDAAARSEALALLRAPVALFARQGEERLGITGIMQHWQATVMSAITTALDSVPIETSLFSQGRSPLQLTTADETAMHGFFHNHKGHGAVCTTMDKAANILVLCCPKMYVSDIMHDFESGFVHAAVHDDPHTLQICNIELRCAD